MDNRLRPQIKAGCFFYKAGSGAGVLFTENYPFEHNVNCHTPCWEGGTPLITEQASPPLSPSFLMKELHNTGWSLRSLSLGEPLDLRGLQLLLHFKICIRQVQK